MSNHNISKKGLKVLKSQIAEAKKEKGKTQSGYHWISIVKIDRIEVGISENGCWVISKNQKSTELTLEVLDGLNFITWLPILELKVSTFKEMLLNGLAALNLRECEIESFPFCKLLSIALKSGSLHWIDVATLWLLDDPSLYLDKDLLIKLQNEKKIPQNIQHRIKKIINRI